MTEQYQKYRNKMNFGDVIAFSGNGFVSNIIKLRTWSNISHVGLIYDVSGRFGNRRLTLMESTTLTDAPDIKHGNIIKGVQQHYLSSVIDRYDGKVYWGKLLFDVSSEQAMIMDEWLTQAHHQKTPYDSVQALGAGMDLFDRLGLTVNNPDFSKLFCSELIAKAYKKAGFYEGNPSEATPKDIVELPYIGNLVRLK